MPISPQLSMPLKQGYMNFILSRLEWKRKCLLALRSRRNFEPKSASLKKRDVIYIDDIMNR